MNNSRRSQGTSRNSTPRTATPNSGFQSEDPEGEEAYQRAFHDAANMKPPRVPNPIAYPNSASAQAHLRNRTARHSQPSITRVGNSTYIPPPEDVHSKRRKEHWHADHPDSADRNHHSSSASPSIKQESSSFSNSNRDQDYQSPIRAPPHRQNDTPYTERHHDYHEHQYSSGSLPMHPRPPENQQQSNTPDRRYERIRPIEPLVQAPSGPRNPFK